MPDQVYDMLSHPPKRFGSVERTCCVASRGKLAPMGKAIRTHKANPSNPRLARTRTSHQNFVEYQDFLNRMYVVGLLTKSTTKAMVKRKIEEKEAKEDWKRCARGLVDTGGGKGGRDKIVADDKDKGDSTDKQHSSEVIPLSSYGDGTPRIIMHPIVKSQSASRPTTRSAWLSTCMTMKKLLKRRFVQRLAHLKSLSHRDSIFFPLAMACSWPTGLSIVKCLLWSMHRQLMLLVQRAQTRVSGTS